MNAILNVMFTANVWKTTIFCHILFFMAILYLFVQKRRRGRMLKMLESFNTRSTKLLIGNVRFSVGNCKKNFHKITNSMIKWQFPALRWIFHIPLIFVGTPDDVQKVLRKTNDRGLLRMYAKSFGSGILLSKGKKWYHSRRIIDSTFSLSMLKKYLLAFHEHSEILIKKIHPLTDTNNAFDIGEYLTCLSIDTTIQNTTGFQLQSLENGKTELLQAMEELLNLDTARYSRPELFLDFAYNLYLYFTGKHKIQEKIENFIQQIIQAKITDRESREKLTKNLDAEIETETETLLDRLLDVQNSDSGFTKEHVLDELLSMIFAGSFTTARTVGFMLLMMAKHPDTQEKAFQEIQAIFKHQLTDIKIEDLNQLVYLEQCINETLRKFPAIPITFRKSSENIQLNDEQTIPANCNIVISIYAIHHNKNLYSNAQNWDPDRFTREAVCQRSQSDFLPFGLGPRSCVGAKYAMISMKTQLVHLLYNYRFSTDMKTEDLFLGIDAALKSENGYWLKCWQRRNNNDS